MIKIYKNIDTFSDAVLKLDRFEQWLISSKVKLIKQIIHKRTQLGITQSQLAESLGTTQSVISRLENGISSQATLDYLFRIANLLQISVTLKNVA